jgi:hypothetical protein
MCPLQVRLVCPGVFVASVALLSRGQLQPVRVLVDSVDKASSIDPWGTARHQVCVCVCLCTCVTFGRPPCDRLTMMHGPRVAGAEPCASLAHMSGVCAGWLMHRCSGASTCWL